MRKILFTILLLTSAIQAQVQFVANVSKASLGINERLRIDFVMNEEGDDFNPPSFEGFQVVGGPNQSVSYQWLNGRKSFEKSYSYFLQPIKKGSLVIKSATIQINNQIYKTAPIKIMVGSAVAQEKDPYNPYYNPPPQQSAPLYVGKEGVHLVAEISDTNPYLNQPITVVYKIYVSNRSAVNGWQEVQNPKYSNFWSQNIDIKQLQIQQGKFKGENYRYAVLRKTVLYPQKSGKLEIEPLTLDIEVEVPTGEVDFFGTPITKTAIKKVSAGAKTIMVKPLPEVGKPANFGGAVGNFTLQTSANKTSIKTGEALELKVGVSGTGNLKLFTLPKPEIPSQLEVYDPVHQENIQTLTAGMTGQITDTYTIVPQTTGKQIIPSVAFSYFDLSTKTYKTITSNSITLLVSQGDASVANTTRNKTNISAKKAFGFIKTTTQLQPINSRYFTDSLLFYILALLPLLAVLAIIAYGFKQHKNNINNTTNKSRISNKLAKTYLAEAQKHLQNKQLFYIALQKAMHNFLKAKLHIETTDMSKDKITQLLLEKQVEPALVSQFIALTESCELARYAPSTTDSIQQDYDLAINIISDLEKQIL